MTRVIVLGPYPPTADPVGDVVLAEVRRLRAGGATVVVVSPEPSAAPEHGDPTRRRDAGRVARVLRGARRVVWFAPPGATPAGRLRGVLAAVPDVEVRPVPPLAIPERASLRARLARLRAGAPTFLRTVAARRTGRVRRAPR